MQALKNQYLTEMGVDVWVLRKERPSPQAPVSKSRPAARAELSQSINAGQPGSPVSDNKPAVPKAPAPEFHLCFAIYERLSLVFDVPLGATSLPEQLRRFADDIARACGDTSEPTVSALKWPMVKADHIDQSEEAAQLIVGQRIDTCRGRIFAFGETASKFLVGRDCTSLDAIRTFFEEPLKKRELWRTVVGKTAR